MPNRGRYSFARPLAGLLAGGLALAAASSGSALAAYGPTQPPTTPVPGGFYCVVTSQTAAQGAGLRMHLRLSGERATLRVRRRTFAHPVQITITEPFARRGSCQGGHGIGDAGFPGFLAVGGLGLVVQSGGNTYPGSFGRPVRIRLDSPLIGRSSLLVAWNGRRFVRVRRAMIRRGTASAAVRAGTDFAVLTPARHGHAAPAP
jgi:hypothetical protein